MREFPIPLGLVLLSLPSSISAQEISGGEWRTYATLSAIPGTTLDSRAFVVPDCDGDGIEDLAQNGFQAIHLFRSTDGTLIRTLSLSGLIVPNIPSLAGDLDADATPDFLIGMLSSPGGISVISGSTGSIIQTMASPGPGIDSINYHQIAVGDLDADGIDDVLVGNGHAAYLFHGGGVVLAYSGASGNLLYQIDGTYSDENLGSNICAAGDLDSDGFDDFVVASAGHSAVPHDGFARLFSGRTGNLLWEIPGIPSATFDFGQRTLDLASDLDGDGLPDLLVSSGNETIAYSTVTQQEIRRYPFHTVDATMDLNGDGLSELAEGFPGFTFRDGHSGNTLLEDGDSYAVLDTRLNLGTPSVVVGHDEFLNDHIDLLAFRPFLTMDGSTISVSSGDNITLVMDFGLPGAGQDYALLLSASGIGPTVFGGVDVPIAMDALTSRCITGRYPQAFSAPRGTLDASGQATCKVLVFPGQWAGAVGRRLTMASGLIINGVLTKSSTAMQIDLLP